MKKEIIIILVILLVVGAIYGIVYWNQKNVDDKWNDKCKTSGGKVVESGKVCDYLNCDHRKYSCNMYS